MRLIDTGPFLFRLEQAPPEIFSTVDQLYGGSHDEHDRPADFRISLGIDALLRRFLRPQITFRFGDARPFKAVPLSQAYPILEWGMNWCIGAHDFTHLLVHAAVLVRDGRAVIFPAHPGSGKSTLSACLGLSGWELYSDEMAVIDIDSLLVLPSFRPACLKNQSIDLVRERFPDVCMSRRFEDTTKGDVCHVRVVDRRTFERRDPAAIVGVVFPRYSAGAPFEAEALSGIDSFENLVRHSFNYHILGETAFGMLARIVDTSRAFAIEYSDLDHVAAFLEDNLGSA